MQKGNPWALLPIAVFLVVFIGCGILFGDFYAMPAIVGFLIALVTAFLQNPKRTFAEKLSSVTRSMGDENVMIMCLVFVLAGAFSGAVQAAGGVDSTVNFGLSILPPQIAVAGLFLIGCFISTAMGTSVGTIVALAPIAAGISEKTGIAGALCMGAVVSGAMFGDNLSMISDTTIAATRGAGCKMNDKFKMNGLIALPAALIAIVIYCLVGSGGELAGAYEYSLIKILPYIVVLVTALIGLNVVLVLLLGTIVAGVIGFATGSLTLATYSAGITDGISGMASIIIVTIILRGLTGIAKEYGGIDWLVEKMGKHMHTRRSAEYGMCLLTGLVDMSMGNNTMAILVSAPLAMRFARKFNISRKRVASLLDISACVFQSFIPHGGQLMLGISMTGLSPFALIAASYYPILLGLATIVTIQFGLLKTKEEKNGISLYPEGEEEAAAAE